MSKHIMEPDHDLKDPTLTEILWTVAAVLTVIIVILEFAK